MVILLSNSTFKEIPPSQEAAKIATGFINFITTIMELWEVLNASNINIKAVVSIQKHFFVVNH